MDCDDKNALSTPALALLQARKDFIEVTRQQVTTMRDEVQNSSMCDNMGSPTVSAKGNNMMGGLGSKGYGKVGLDDHCAADIEMTSPPMHIASDAADEILGEICRH